MGTNKEIIEKADMALADLATAGRLLPEQENRFIRKLIDSPTILAQVRTVVMTGPEMKLNKIGFGSRILRPAVSATALAAGDRVKPDLSQLTLNTKEVIAEIRIPYDVIEDNIERGRVNGKMQEGAGGLHQTIVDLIGERAALDLEELSVKGDTALVGTDAYLGMMDGYLKRSNVNVVVWDGAFDKDCIKAAVKTMPDKYLRDRAAMLHMVSVDNETELRDQYANRQTAAGDSHLQGHLPLMVFGSRVSGHSMMPGANALYCNPRNLVFGIQRGVQIEYDKIITERVFVIVLTARIGTQIEETEAVVKTTGITGG